MITDTNVWKNYFTICCTLFNSLGFNGIGDEGATALADALQVNQSLTTLK